MTSPFRNLLASAALAAAALGTAACEPSREPVEIDWTFGGKDCAAAGVATIQIDVANEVLTPNRYACQDGAGHVTTGAQIGTYLLGGYTATVQGFDSGGNVIYSSSQQFSVARRSHNVFAIDASPIAATTGSIELTWKFAGQTCAQAGVTAVHVKLDGQSIMDGAGNADLPCHSGTGAGTDGTELSPIDPGTHRLDLEGLKNGQVAFSLANVSAPVTAGQMTTLNENLQSVSTTTASAQVKWTFAGLSCVEGKVNSVRVSIDGVQTGSDYPCTVNGADAGLITNLSAGEHAITLTGIRTGNALVYQTTQATTASVSNGLTTQVLIDVPSATPGKGGAKLLWGGGVCASTTTAATISYKITPPTGAATMGTSTCGGASANAGIEFCNPVAAGCPAGSPGLIAGNWTIDATATAGSTTSTASAVHFGVPNVEENTSNVTFQ